jgi:hypothetical protein
MYGDKSCSPSVHASRISSCMCASVMPCIIHHMTCCSTQQYADACLVIPAMHATVLLCHMYALLPLPQHKQLPWCSACSTHVGQHRSLCCTMVPDTLVLLHETLLKWSRTLWVTWRRNSPHDSAHHACHKHFSQPVLIKNTSPPAQGMPGDLDSDLRRMMLPNMPDTCTSLSLCCIKTRLHAGHAWGPRVGPAPHDAAQHGLITA